MKRKLGIVAAFMLVFLAVTGCQKQEEPTKEPEQIMDGFMIQGGDPNGDGTGGADKTIKGEFSSNGVENEISHTRGTISMARAQDPDSASSQFFIVQEDSDYLDGDYAAFGHVTSGMEIVDQICKDVPVEDDNGTVKAENQPVIEKITITD